MLSLWKQLTETLRMYFALLAYIKHQKQIVLLKKKMKLARFFGVEAS